MAQSSIFVTSRRESALGIGLRLGDIGVVLLFGLLAFYLRFQNLSISASYQLALALGALLAFNCLSLAGVYSQENTRRPLRRFGRVAIGWALTFLLLAALSVSTKSGDIFSRVWFFSWSGGCLLGFLFLRFIAAARIASWQTRGRGLKQVAIVGVGQRASQLAHHLQQTEGDMVKVVGFFRTILSYLTDRFRQTAEEAFTEN